MNGYAIGFWTYFKLISKLQFELTLIPEIREIQFWNLIRPFVHQERFFKIEQFRIGFACLFPPAVEMAARDHFRTYALIVEVEQYLLVHQNIAAARFVFKIFHFLDQAVIFFEEFVIVDPFAFHHCRANKNFAAHRWVNAAIINQAFLHNRNAIECDFFIRHHSPFGLRPMWLAVTAFHQMLC